MSDISERVKKIVVEHLGVEKDKVVDSASFVDDLGADSLDTVELVMAFEEEFNIEIPDEAAEKIQTIELGFKGFLSERVHMTTDYYMSRYEDFFSAPTVITPLIILNVVVWRGSSTFSSSAFLLLNSKNCL